MRRDEMHDLAIWHVGLFGVGQWKGVGKGLASVSVGTKGRPAGAIVSIPGPSESTQRRWPEAEPSGLVDVWEIPEVLDDQLVRVIAAGGSDVARRSGARHLGPARITDERVSVPSLSKDDDRPSYRYGLTVALTDSWLKLLMLGGGSHVLVCMTVQRELFGEAGMPNGSTEQLQKATTALGMALVVNEEDDDGDAVTVDQAKDAVTALSETQQNEQTQMAVVVLRSLVEQPLATCTALARRAMVREMAKLQGCQSLPAVQLAVGNLLAEKLIRRCAGTDEHPVYEATDAGVVENTKIAAVLAEKVAAQPAETETTGQRVRIVADGGALAVDGKGLLSLSRLTESLSLHRYTSRPRITMVSLAAIVTGLLAQDCDDVPAVSDGDLLLASAGSWLVDKGVLAWPMDVTAEPAFDITDACLRAAEHV